MTEPDLFSGGFAWGDEGVAASATPVATARPATPAPYKQGVSLVLGARVASVASVADYRADGVVSRNGVASSATADATPESTAFRGVDAAVVPRVADVASVANWLEGVEVMRLAGPGPMMWHGTWKVVIRDALAFIRTWGAEAIAAGWSTLDVFGTNLDASARRVDRLGLVVMLDGRPIRSLDRDCAVIGTSPGVTKFRRALRTSGAVAIWDLPMLGGAAGGRG